MASSYNFVSPRTVAFQRQILIVSHSREPPIDTDKCTPQRISSEPLFGDQERMGESLVPQAVGAAMEGGQLIPFLPTDGACGLSPTNQDPCTMLSQDTPGREAQQRPPADGAPSGELTRTSSWGHQPPRFLHLLPCINVIESRWVSLGFYLLRIHLLAEKRNKEPINIFVFVCHADVNSYDFISNCLGARPDLI